MSTFQIKVIAILTMVIDHVGLYFFPELTVLRVIGRLSFPLFAWLIANGAYHTKNISQYTVRIFVFALISQVPYLLVNRTTINDFVGLNIFFTLGLGLLAIQLIRKTNKKILWMLITALFSLIGFVLHVDYDAAGVLSIVFFYIYFNHVGKMILTQAFLFFAYYTIPVLEQLTRQQVTWDQINMVALLQPIAVVSVIFIARYSGKEGKKAKYLFYIFYPLHLIVIYIIKSVFGF